jgi:hypothetical protein
MSFELEKKFNFKDVANLEANAWNSRKIFIFTQKKFWKSPKEIPKKIHKVPANSIFLLFLGTVMTQIRVLNSRKRSISKKTILRRFYRKKTKLDKISNFCPHLVSVFWNSA